MHFYNQKIQKLSVYKLCVIKFHTSNKSSANCIQNNVGRYKLNLNTYT